MKEFILKLFNITPNLHDQVVTLHERADHLRHHIVIMEEKLDRIEHAITFILAEHKK